MDSIAEGEEAEYGYEYEGEEGDEYGEEGEGEYEDGDGEYADDGEGEYDEGEYGEEGEEGEYDEGVDEGDEPGAGDFDEEADDGDDGGVDPAQEAKLAELEAARQRALRSMHFGFGKHATESTTAAPVLPVAPSAPVRSGAITLQATSTSTSKPRSAFSTPTTNNIAADVQSEKSKLQKRQERFNLMQQKAEQRQQQQKDNKKQQKHRNQKDQNNTSTSAFSAFASKSSGMPSAFGSGVSAFVAATSAFGSTSAAPSFSSSPSPPPAASSSNTHSNRRSTASMMAAAMGTSDDIGGGGEDGGTDFPIHTAETFKPIQGLCHAMCPVEEAKAREESRDLSYFEMVPGTGSKEHGDVPLVDLSKAVKKYKRAAAAQMLRPEDVRPMAALQRTMEYLVTKIMDRTDTPDPPPLPHFLVVYRFVSDRFRALRQDFVCQMLRGPDVVRCYEIMVRFHILSMYELGDINNIEKYDPTPNVEKLSQTLTSLRHMYFDNYINATRGTGGGSDGVTSTAHTVPPFSARNEAEMHSYRLLIDLDRRFGTLYEELDKFDPSVKNSPIIRFCLAVYNAFREGNYARFFDLARHAPYFHACLLQTYFNKVRIMATRRMEAAYKHYPLEAYTTLLAFEDSDHAADFLTYHGVSISGSSSDPSTSILFSSRHRGSGGFHLPDTPYSFRNSHRVIAPKRPPTISQAVMLEIGSGAGIDLGLTKTERMELDAAPSSAALQRQRSATLSRQASRAALPPPSLPSASAAVPSPSSIPTFGGVSMPPLPSSIPSSNSFPIPSDAELSGIVSKPVKLQRSRHASATPLTPSALPPSQSFSPSATTTLTQLTTVPVASKLNPKAAPFVPGAFAGERGMASSASVPGATSAAFGATSASTSSTFGGAFTSASNAFGTPSFGVTSSTFGSVTAPSSSSPFGAAAAATTSFHAFGTPTPSAAPASQSVATFATASTQPPAPLASTAASISFGVPSPAGASTGTTASSQPSPAPLTNISGFRLPLPSEAKPATSTAIPPSHPRTPIARQKSGGVTDVSRGGSPPAASPLSAFTPSPSSPPPPSAPRMPSPPPKPRVSDSELFMRALRFYKQSLVRSSLHVWHENAHDRAVRRAEYEKWLEEKLEDGNRIQLQKWMNRWIARTIRKQSARAQREAAEEALHGPPRLLKSVGEPKFEGEQPTRIITPSSSTALTTVSDALIVHAPQAAQVRPVFIPPSSGAGLLTPFERLHLMGVNVEDEDEGMSEEEEQTETEEEQETGANEDVGFEKREGEYDDGEYAEEGDAFDEGEAPYSEGAEAETQTAGKFEQEEKYPSTDDVDLSRSAFISPARPSLPFTSPARSGSKRSRMERGDEHLHASNGARATSAFSPSPLRSAPPSAQQDARRNTSFLYDASDVSVLDGSGYMYQGNGAMNMNGSGVGVGVGAADGDGDGDGDGDDIHAPSSTRAKLFHTPAQMSTRAVFSPAMSSPLGPPSPWPRSAKQSDGVSDRYDISAALAAATPNSSSLSPLDTFGATYFKPRHSASPSISHLASPFTSPSHLPHPHPTSDSRATQHLLQELQEEEEENRRLNELMEQLEYQYAPL